MQYLGLVELRTFGCKDTRPVVRNSVPTSPRGEQYGTLSSMCEGSSFDNSDPPVLRSTLATWFLVQGLRAWKTYVLLPLNCSTVCETDLHWQARRYSPALLKLALFSQGSCKVRSTQV
jgi:hypothetical protein